MLNFLSSARARAVARFLVSALAVTALLFLFLALLFWFVEKPKLIEYKVIRAVAKDYKLTPPLNSSSTIYHLSGTFYFTVAANNTNKRLSVHYDRLEVVVASTEYPSGQRVPLELTGVPALRKINSEQTWLELRFEKQSMQADRGEAIVDMRIRARIRFQYAGIPTWPFSLEVFCAGVVINLSTPPPLGAPSFQSDLKCDAGFL